MESRPIMRGTLKTVFGAAPGVAGTARSYVRARQLVLYRTTIATGFFQAFRIGPYRLSS